jgi:hypothetical protein
MGLEGGKHHVWPSHLQKRLEKVSVRLAHLNEMNEDDEPVILIILLCKQG